MAYEAGGRLDFFSIVRFLGHYNKWNGGEVAAFYDEEVELAKERAEGDVELMNEHNRREEYLRLARFKEEGEI